MPRNTSQHDIVSYRREVVASLRLRGLTQRAITKQMADDGLLNPETGKPFSLGTINDDIRALEEAWRQQAMADTALRQGRILAELDEVRRVAWSRADLSTVLRALKQECDLINRQRAGSPSTTEQYAESLPGRLSNAYVHQDSTFDDLITRAQRLVEPAKLTDLLDEYEILEHKRHSLIDTLRQMADATKLPSPGTEHNPETGNGYHGGNGDEATSSI